MMPQLFGDSAAPLYGVLHPSARSGTTRVAAVVCAPLGHEYLQAHRVLRKLADEVASRGIPSLRFDYMGTGDSSGDADAVTLTQLRSDTSHAIDEVRGLTRARKVVLIALRGGAFPALLNLDGASVIGCVLWDPVIDGTIVVNSLSAEAMAASTDTRSLGGFEYSKRFQDDLASFDPSAHWPVSPCDVRIVAHSDADFAELRSRKPQLMWIQTANSLDFGTPGSQDLLHVAEGELMQVVDVVESIANG